MLHGTLGEVGESSLWFMLVIFDNPTRASIFKPPELTGHASCIFSGNVFVNV